MGETLVSLTLPSPLNIVLEVSVGTCRSNLQSHIKLQKRVVGVHVSLSREFDTNGGVLRRVEGGTVFGWDFDDILPRTVGLGGVRIAGIEGDHLPHAIVHFIMGSHLFIGSSEKGSIQLECTLNSAKMEALPRVCQGYVISSGYSWRVIHEKCRVHCIDY